MLKFLLTRGFQIEIDRAVVAHDSAAQSAMVLLAKSRNELASAAGAELHLTFVDPLNQLALISC